MSTVNGKGGQPNRRIGVAGFMVEGSLCTLAVNLDESPLASLMRRKSKHGAAYLSLDEFNAGERLRADFTRGCMMQRVSANWSATVSGGKRGSGLADLTDNALAARMRLEKALDAVGPELSGVLVDVCCYLKGIEQVELERQWPARSAKLMLKTALGTLARHYNPAPLREKAAMRHWGGEGYRPAI